MDETPTTERESSDLVSGAVDYKNCPALRSNTGCWRSAAYIIGADILEKFTYVGVQSNLITYLTGPLGQSTAVAAVNINFYVGTSLLLPLFGAFVADAFLGQFRTILFAYLFYILGLGLLTLSTILPSLLGFDCETSSDTSCSPPLFQVIMFFSSLYLIVIAQSGHDPCTQAFGADQFDGQDPLERHAKSSFFNWWFFSMCSGVLATNLILVYVQDNLGWALGFGIPCVLMVFALVLFLLGTKTYRYANSMKERGSFSRIGRVFIATFRNRQAISSVTTSSTEDNTQFEFLKALIVGDELEGDSRVCSVSEVEEAKGVVKLIPIGATCLIYGIVVAQNTTFFTKQAATMERTIFLGFKVPAATLQCFRTVTVLAFIPIYDEILVPIARVITGKPSGITMLQRVGNGVFISVFAMVIAALVEMKRLKTAEEYGLLDEPTATVPMSVWWLVPQYVLFGITEVFTLIGLQEFFYDQVPIELRSVGIALYLSVFGVGSFLSSFVVIFIDKATGRDGRDSWFSNNLNKARLDYFYFFLAGLSALGFACFLHFSRLYIYNRRVL